MGVRVLNNRKTREKERGLLYVGRGNECAEPALAQNELL